MNDPHVEALLYKLVPAKDVTFKDPASVTFETPDFRGTLSDHLLTLEPKAHYASPDDVRPLANSFVLAWMVKETALRGRDDTRFVYDDARVVDRARLQVRFT